MPDLNCMEVGDIVRVNEISLGFIFDSTGTVVTPDNVDQYKDNKYASFVGQVGEITTKFGMKKVIGYRIKFEGSDEQVTVAPHQLELLFAK